MPTRPHSLCLALTLVICAVLAPPMPAQATKKPFIVYDNVYYQHAPNMQPYGLQPLNLIYDSAFWKDRTNETELPTRTAFDAVAKQQTKPGPVVLDIEYVGLNSPETLKILETLLDWTHQDLPGKAVGFYGTNTLTKVKPENMVYARALAAKVDAMFPPMYTYDKDQAAWAARAQRELDEAHSLAPGKPVYFYLQPQYHHTTPLAYQYVEGDYWAFQLKTARGLSDGVVIWTGSRWPWINDAAWWAATQEFMSTLRP